MRSGNVNHPKRGSTIKVEPIKELKDIKAIKKLLADSPRDLALFVLGINTNLRASDLVRLTAGQFRGVPAGGEIELREKKTGKLRRITLNRAVVEAVQALLASRPYQDGDWLFPGRAGKHINANYVNRLVKRWCGMINLRGNFGAHTLRKTWGYHQRVTFGVDASRLMLCFNHSSLRQTMDYLCIQPEEIRSVYENEL